MPRRKAQRSEEEEIEFQLMKKSKNAEAQRRFRNKNKTNQADLSLATNVEPAQTKTLDRSENPNTLDKIIQNTQNSYELQNDESIQDLSEPA